MTPSAAIIAAPAKITWSLRVTGIADSGLHEVEAEMFTIDLADQLVITPGGSGLTVHGDSAVRLEQIGPAQENLVTRAMSLLKEPVGIELTKRIPIGGGLGGGSADAAAVLRYGNVTDTEGALQLGSDVPFCLIGGRALVSGTGEKVSQLDERDRSLVLLVPPVFLETAAVYRAFDQLLDEGANRDERNDLHPAARLVAPELVNWEDVFKEATGATPVLAGSGSTLFVEGTKESLGLSGAATLGINGQEARLIDVRSVSAQFGEPMTERSTEKGSA